MANSQCHRASYYYSAKSADRSEHGCGSWAVSQTNAMGHRYYSKTREGYASS